MGGVGLGIEREDDSLRFEIVGGVRSSGVGDSAGPVELRMLLAPPCEAFGLGSAGTGGGEGLSDEVDCFDEAFIGFGTTEAEKSESGRAKAFAP